MKPGALCNSKEKEKHESFVTAMEIPSAIEGEICILNDMRSRR